VVFAFELKSDARRLQIFKESGGKSHQFDAQTINAVFIASGNVTTILRRNQDDSPMNWT